MKTRFDRREMAFQLYLPAEQVRIKTLFPQICQSSSNRRRKNPDPARRDQWHWLCVGAAGTSGMLRMETRWSMGIRSQDHAITWLAAPYR